MTLIEGVRIALLLTGVVVWYLGAVALFCLAVAVVCSWLEKRRTRRVMARWAAMEDERRRKREEARALQEAAWDIFVESRVTGLIRDCKGKVPVEGR